MRVPLTIADHLARAELVYPDRIGVIDEPTQPAAPWGELTYARVAELARGQAAWLDGLGIGRGERVAVVSHNAARLLVSFFGVSAWGRVLVPINFRLSADEVRYIVDHSGSSVLLVDPELDEALADVGCKHRLVLGAGTDDTVWPTGAEPEPWADPDEDATATINYTSGTTARPKGVQLTHRNLWLNAAVFGWHTGVSDRDVYLHTLPMFHCNGWGMPYALTGSTATASPCCAGRRRWCRPSSTRPSAGTGPSRGATGPAWWWPAPRRPPGSSSARRPSSAGSSSRSTA
jgi:acyl-CoA synthetase (AMP-forming)/AMP-acid ligase II